jgi:hypothetical protein
MPRPIHSWNFKENLKDHTGSAHGEARDGAQVKDGALIFGRNAHVITAPLQKAVKEKTLEAWVQLDQLDQSGAGVISLQTKHGAVFDAIVFGERDPQQWLAGSNFFQRTQSFNAPRESEAQQRPVHLAIAYHSDGTIIGYRDGQPYGKSYRSAGPFEFKAGEAVVGFGIRHLPAGGNKMLAGRILRASLYDRALTADEVFASFRSLPSAIGDTQLLQALMPIEREKVLLARNQIAALEAQIRALGPIPAAGDEKAIWSDLARAIFSFKEFIYIK